jgi:hypothetical protein
MTYLKSIGNSYNGAGSHLTTEPLLAHPLRKLVDFCERNLKSDY